MISETRGDARDVVSVLLVEDDPTIHDALAPFVAGRGWELRYARSVREADAELARRRADIVLLDRNLPGPPGDELARRLGGGPTPFILLTARSSEADRLIGFDLGADDYVTKPFSAAELMRRIEVVLRRHGTQRVRIARDVDLDRDERVIRTAHGIVHVTPIEFKLLEQLSRRPGRVYSREELLELLALDAETSDRTFDSHVKNIRRKFRAAQIVGDVIRTVPGIGYALAVRS
ncbi:MAG: response regulator transcription factor [Vulcanimicrobiaceae bacterium]